MTGFIGNVPNLHAWDHRNTHLNKLLLPTSTT